MAETLKEFNFGRLRSRGSDYTAYMDGQIWMLTSEDSPSGTAALTSMQTRLANIAREMGLNFRSNIATNPDDPDQEVLVIQATTPTETEEK